MALLQIILHSCSVFDQLHVVTGQSCRLLVYFKVDFRKLRRGRSKCFSKLKKLYLTGVMCLNIVLCPFLLTLIAGLCDDDISIFSKICRQLYLGKCFCSTGWPHVVSGGREGSRNDVQHQGPTPVVIWHGVTNDCCHFTEGRDKRAIERHIPGIYVRYGHSLNSILLAFNYSRIIVKGMIFKTQNQGVCLGCRNAVVQATPQTR